MGAVITEVTEVTEAMEVTVTVVTMAGKGEALMKLTKNPLKYLDPTLRPMLILKLKPIMVIDGTEREVLTLNLMVTTVTMVILTLMVTTDTIMANVALKLRLIPAHTTMVIMVMVWDLSMVMVIIHTLTMVTTSASGQLFSVGFMG